MNAVLNLLLNAHQSDPNWLKLIHYNIQCNDQLVLFITFNIYLLARKLYSREFLNISYIPESLLKSWKSPNINCNILWGTGFWSFRPNFYLQIGTSNETLPLNVFFFGALQKHCLCSIIWRESGNGNLSILIVPKLGKLPIKYFDSG